MPQALKLCMHICLPGDDRAGCRITHLKPRIVRVGAARRVNVDKSCHLLSLGRDLGSMRLRGYDCRGQIRGSGDRGGN